MANQAIALQARAPQQGNFLAPAIQQAGQMANRMAQQQALDRQTATAEQALKVSQAEEARKAAIAPAQEAEAGAKAGSAKVKYVSDFMETSALALANVRDPQQAMAVGDRLKQLFPEPEFKQSVDETIAYLTEDPAQFDVRRQESLVRTLDAKDQLAKTFETQKTGTEQRTIAIPTYGGGAATEVPGSRFASAQDIQYVKGPDDSVTAMPKTMPGTGGFGAPAPAAPAAGLVGGPRGGAMPMAPSTGAATPVATALQTNPGAIKDSPYARSQPGYAGSSGGFATFDTPQAGIAAQENLLSKNYVNKGVNTINKIISRYAPPGGENAPAAVSNYKNYVAQRAGIDVNAPITAAQVPAVAAAMREFETGVRPGGRTPVPRGGAGGVQFGQVVPGMQGSGKKDGKTTESERRFGTIAKQMRSNIEEATNILTNSPEVIKPSGTEYLAKQIPFYGDEASLFAQSEARQQFVPAVLRFLDNVTYVNTGAGVTVEQKKDYMRSYVPTYQDTPASAHRKLVNMITFAKNVKDAAGSQWTPDMDASFKTLEQAVAKLKPAAAAGKTATATQKTPVTKPPAGIAADDWKYMTPEERRLWQK